MTLQELIELAVEKLGSRQAVADGLHQDKQRLTDWKAGRRKPDAHEVAYLAKVAGLPVLATVAEIESQLDERYASVWREALGKLKAAGVAASVLACAFGLSPTTANATGSHGTVSGSVYYVNS